MAHRGPIADQDGRDRRPRGLAEAKNLNRAGLLLLDTDTEGALALFRRSRALVASGRNITNIAICLDRLGLYDEALEAYEIVFTKYASDLEPEDSAAIAPAIAALRGKVGNLTVASSAGGTLVIDGRRRAELPQDAPVRVTQGSRVIRVVRMGYKTFERTVEIKAGTAVVLDATLEPLVDTGILEVPTRPKDGTDP